MQNDRVELELRHLVAQRQRRSRQRARSASPPVPDRSAPRRGTRSAAARTSATGSCVSPPPHRPAPGACTTSPNNSTVVPPKPTIMIGPKVGIVHHADDQFMALRRHALHQHAVDPRIRLVRARHRRASQCRRPCTAARSARFSRTPPASVLCGRSADCTFSTTGKPKRCSGVGGGLGGVHEPFGRAAAATRPAPASPDIPARSAAGPGYNRPDTGSNGIRQRSAPAPRRSPPACPSPRRQSRRSLCTNRPHPAAALRPNSDGSV